MWIKVDKCPFFLRLSLLTSWSEKLTFQKHEKNILPFHHPVHGCSIRNSVCKKLPGW